MKSMPEGKTQEDNAQTPQPKRGTHIIFITTLIIVLLILSVSSLFFIQISKGKDSQLTTSIETPTPTPTPTSIYLETPPPQAVFYDTFKNNALGWSISSTAGYYRTVKPGKLTLTNTNQGTTLIESLPTNSIYDNFKVSVDLTVIKASGKDSIGIYIRGDSNLEHDYRIDLNGNGTFDIAKEYLDSRNNPQSIFLDGPRNSSALHPPGVQNTITVILNGSQLQLFLNNVKVGTVIDSDYMVGQVALFAHAGEDSQDVTVSFSRVEIDKLQENLPG